MSDVIDSLNFPPKTRNDRFKMTIEEIKWRFGVSRGKNWHLGSKEKDPNQDLGLSYFQRHFEIGKA